MNLLLDPNVAYLLLLAGILLGLFALVTPGTGVLEIGAFSCLGLAGYAVSQLEFNWWALVLLVLSVILFLVAIRQPKWEVYLALSILVLGGYAVSQREFTWWPLVFLVLSVILFLVATRQPKWEVYLALSILVLVI